MTVFIRIRIPAILFVLKTLQIKDRNPSLRFRDSGFCRIQCSYFVLLQNLIIKLRYQLKIMHLYASTMYVNAIITGLRCQVNAIPHLVFQTINITFIQQCLEVIY